MSTVPGASNFRYPARQIDLFQTDLFDRREKYLRNRSLAKIIFVSEVGRETGRSRSDHRGFAYPCTLHRRLPFLTSFVQSVGKMSRKHQYFVADSSAVLEHNRREVGDAYRRFPVFPVLNRPSPVANAHCRRLTFSRRSQLRDCASA